MQMSDVITINGVPFTRQALLHIATTSSDGHVITGPVAAPSSDVPATDGLEAPEKIKPKKATKAQPKAVDEPTSQAGHVTVSNMPPASMKSPSLVSWSEFESRLFDDRRKHSEVTTELAKAKTLKEFASMVCHSWASDPVSFIAVAMSEDKSFTPAMILSSLEGSNGADLRAALVAAGLTQTGTEPYSPFGLRMRKHTGFIQAWFAEHMSRRAQVQAALTAIVAKVGSEKASILGSYMIKTVDSDPEKAFAPLANGFKSVGAVDAGRFLRACLLHGDLSWPVLTMWLQGHAEVMDGWMSAAVEHHSKGG